MNQVQRKFLIDKIKAQVETTCRILRESRPVCPNLNIWLLHAVLSGKFEIRTTEEIKEVLRRKALTAKEREDWLGNSWGNANKNNVYFKPEEIFIVPDEYTKELEDYRQRAAQIDKEIAALQMQADTLITRIQLASDKLLQKMINEVDDMGDLSLMDTKLKLLN